MNQTDAITSSDEMMCSASSITQQPLVSVIVPCYQSESTIGQTLRSVIRQTLKNWECIVVNDGSTDASGSIARRWQTRDSRFRVLNKENGGLPAARNSGIQEARGRFLAFLDSDDCFYPHTLVSFIGAAERVEQAHVYYCDFDIIDGKGQRLGTTKPPQKITFDTLCKANAFAPNAAVVRHEALWDSAPFDESFCACEDWDFWLTLLRRGSHFVKAGEARVAYRRHSGSMSHDASRMYRGTVSLLRKHVLSDVRTTDGPLTRPSLPAMTAHSIVVRHLLLYLGWSLSSSNGSLYETILAESRSLLPRRPLDNVPVETFVYGLLLGLGLPQGHTIRDAVHKYDLSSVLTHLERIEQDLFLPGLAKNVVRLALSDYGQLMNEHKSILTSRSYRLSRAIARGTKVLRSLGMRRLLQRREVSNGTESVSDLELK